MAKPIFIIADTDNAYLETLEMKLLEELGEKIELQVITKRDYFDMYFSQMREANILIISEDLYTREMHKHNIENIILLAEDMYEDTTESMDVFEIYKYTNIKDIYDKIVSISSGSEKMQIQQHKETSVALICSAAGGAGNTTIALGLSEYLAKQYKRVLYINAEEMNCFQYMMGKDAVIPEDIATSLSENAEKAFEMVRPYVTRENFAYVPTFSTPLISVGLDTSIYGNIVKGAKETGKYDVIVVDAGSGLDLMKASLMAESDKVFIVTKQSRASANATNILLKNISRNHNDKYYIVCNDFNQQAYNALSDMGIAIDVYINHIDNMDMMSAKEIGKETEIQELAFLIA